MAGRYLNYNLFGYPVHEKVVLTIVLLIGILLCAAALFLTAHFARGVRRSRRWNQRLQSLGEWLRSKRRPKPLWLLEGRKGLIYGGGLIFICAAILMIWTQKVPVVQQERPEALLTQYIQVYAGDLSRAVLSFASGRSCRRLRCNVVDLHPVSRIPGGGRDRRGGVAAARAALPAGRGLAGDGMLGGGLNVSFHL